MSSSLNCPSKISNVSATYDMNASKPESDPTYLGLFGKPVR